MGNCASSPSASEPSTSKVAAANNDNNNTVTMTAITPAPAPKPLQSVKSTRSTRGSVVIGGDTHDTTAASRHQHQPSATPISTLSSILPVALLADSYKASHYLMYPDCSLMVAYGEFRQGYLGDKHDTRLIYYGIQYIIDTYLHHQWTVKDVDIAEQFYNTHNIGYTEFQFPRTLFLDFIAEFNGYFPVKIESLPEGTVVNAHTPVYQIYAYGKYSRLVTYLETLMTHVWYPTTVATLSRRTKDLIETAFEKSVEEEAYGLLHSRLHDFGMRGCTCIEQSILGGSAHLLNFSGSDTMSAAYYCQYQRNQGKPVATSIPATEHSVMTSWEDEERAIRNMIDKFGGAGKVFAIVMDSYDYTAALNEVLPRVAEQHIAKGGTMILRPDSGDPIECVLEALEAGERVFGSTVNSKGFKVIPHMAVIQGDGINQNTVRGILDAVLQKGYSAENVAFGMGGGLLQRVNRDTMSFATKLSHVKYTATGQPHDIMKKPKTDKAKVSYPGMLQVIRDERSGLLQVEPRSETSPSANNLLQVVYDHGPVKSKVKETFDQLKERVEREWHLCPKTQNVVSPALQQKIDQWIQNFELSHPSRKARPTINAARMSGASDPIASTKQPLQIQTAVLEASTTDEGVEIIAV